MLPSLGLFKELPCPYNKEEGAGCHRPFCHYKHTRKDEPPVKPTYTATPTEILDGKAQPGGSSYPRYIPFPLAELDEGSSSSNQDREDKTNNSRNTSKYKTAEYVPKNVPKPEPEIVYPDIVIDTDLARILGSEDEDGEPLIPTPSGDASVVVENNGNNGISECDDLMQLLADSGDENENEPKAISISGNEKLPEKELPTSSYGDHQIEVQEKKKKTSSTSHSERPRSSSSSGHKSSSRPSSSSSSKHKSSSSSSSSRHRHHHRGDEKRSSSSSSKTKSSSSSSHHHHKSSSSSSSSKRKHKSSDRDRDEDREKKRQRKSFDGCSDSELPKLFLSSDEDCEAGVEEECKRIFDQFEAPPPPPPPAEATNGHQEANSESLLSERFKSDSGENQKSYLETVGAKKRVAHEQTSGGPIIRPFERSATRPKHAQTALQSVYLRAEMARTQRAEEEERAQKELEEKEAQLNRALANASTSTPSSSRRSLVAPVSNIIALQNAKKKIEELKMQQQQKTIARSAPRITGEVANITKRVAHKASGSVDNTSASAAAPPVLEPHSSKINFNLRMQYYNLMVTQCRAIYPSVDDAWERAQTEELAVFNKCSSAVIYKSSATLAINKLRKESISAGHEATERNKLVSHDVILAGKLGQKNSWSINRKLRDNATSSNGDSTIMNVGPLAGLTFDTISSSKAYDLVAECILNEDQLKENGFPRPGPKMGQAIIEGFYRREEPKPRNEEERYCQRCGKLFNVASYELPAKDECNYHPKGTGYRRGFADNQHRCCQQPAGTPGCSYSDYHVSNYTDYANLTGFVKTLDRDESYVCTRKDIFALDCEMVYTTRALELARVTVVDINGKIAYDACVQPDNHVVDYNTQFSGLTEEILRNESRSLRDVQAVLLSMFHSRTILIGHSLDSDLKALKLIHGTVVDTSVLYPHKMGLPKKKALKTLCIDHLKRIIQENEHGHNSAEDAEVCIQLIKAFLKNRIN